MEIIKSLTEKIDDELEDAQKYINCALVEKEKHPELSQVYYKLSLEEMNHMNMLHNEVVKIINNIKKEKPVPPEMQFLYDYLHERQIKWAAKVKTKQDMYAKSN